MKSVYLWYLKTHALPVLKDSLYFHRRNDGEP